MAADKTADAVNYALRLPKGLHKRLVQQAKRKNTSLNQEIVNQLEGYEAATIKRVTEIMQPLLDEAVRMAASEAAGQSALWLRDRTQGEIAHVLAGLLTKELPGFYSLTIETTGDHGELRGTIVYRSGEIAEEEYPGIGEAKRMGREALRRKLAASPPESKEDEESK